MFEGHTFRLFFAITAVFSTASATTSCEVNGHHYNVDSLITKDFAIIGGGSGGTYSAVRLKDYGKSVAVIEAKARLGGHTETYIEPTINKPIDIGVVVFHNFTEVRSYFKRLNVSYSSLPLGGISSGEIGTSSK